MRISIAADHAGYPLKAELVPWLQEQGHEVIDLGTDSTASVDYPPLCAAAGREVVSGGADVGIVLGGSGQGEQIAANKVRGVRAALCHDVWLARMARLHNDANVLSMGARIVGSEVARACVRAFLEGEYQAGRHVARIAKLHHVEAEEANQQA